MCIFPVTSPPALFILQTCVPVVLRKFTCPYNPYQYLVLLGRKMVPTFFILCYETVPIFTQHFLTIEGIERALCPIDQDWISVLLIAVLLCNVVSHLQWHNLDIKNGK